MTRERRAEESRSAWDRYGPPSQIILAGASGVALIASLNGSFLRSSVPAWTILLSVVAGLYVATIFWMLQHLRRTRYLDFRLAMTGQPGSGKTVFSLLLYDRLMNNRDADVTFTAESKSAIATYQAIKGIAADEWPRSTSKGAVLQYDGSLRYGARTVIDLEIGDSAGEYWLELTRDGAESENAYLQYVVSAHAIAHMLPVDVLDVRGSSKRVELSDMLARDLKDLRLAAQLMRSSRASFSKVPILVIISKVDKVVPNVMTEDLLACYPLGDVVNSKVLKQLSRAFDYDLRETLNEFGAQLASDFSPVTFSFSSVLAAGPTSNPGPRERDPLMWIFQSATRDAVRRSRFRRTSVKSGEWIW